jgi:hypothetical protein
LLFVRKNFCDPNLRGGSPEKFFLRKKIFAPPGQHFVENMEKIWENMAPW